MASSRLSFASFTALILGALPAAQHRQLAPGRRLPAVGDPGTVLGVFQLNDTLHPFERTIGERDEFGSALASLGDLDGNGDREYAIGAPGDFQSHGAVWIFSLRPDRTVAVTLKYGPVEALPFELAVGDRFGAAITAIGDVNGDGVDDIAVGAPGDDDGTVPPFSNSGAVWILFLGLDGNIHGHLKFSRTAGGFAGLIEAGDAFGSALAPIGDLDGNGVPDLLVGAPGDNDGGNNRGALWVLFFAPDDTVLAAQRISQTQGGFGGSLANGDGFGASLAHMGDLDGDGMPEVAVGASSVSNGDVWMLSLAATGTVVDEVLTESESPRGAEALVNLGDIDQDGVADLAVGDVRHTVVDPFGGVKVLRLFPDGSVKGSVTLAAPNLPGVGFVQGEFGRALTAPGDTDGDGNVELLVGVPQWSRRAEQMGGMLLYDLTSTGDAVGNPTLIDAIVARLPVAPNALTGPSPQYGRSFASLGDIDGDGFAEIAVGSSSDADGFAVAGAVWIHHLSATDGLRVNKLSAALTTLPLGTGYRFGESLAALSDLDGNGVNELAVGAPGAPGGGVVHVLFLSPSGGLVGHQILTGFDAGLPFPAGFGSRLDAIGDLNLDGVVDLVAQDSTRKRILFLRADGTIESSAQLLIPGSTGGRAVVDYGLAASGRKLLLTHTSSQFIRVEVDQAGQVVGVPTTRPAPAASSLCAPGDIDGDGIRDLVVSVNVVQLLLMNADLTIRTIRTFPGGRGPRALTSLGDVTADGVPDVAGATRFGDDTSAFLSQLGGISTMDFERRDTLDQDLNENGRALPPALTGYTFGLSSLGANLGPAAFDSTPGGPNAASQDPDLLVGSGKVLVLQDSLNGLQTRPGIFDHPNDDVDGGTLVFTPRRPIAPLALRMIDIDRGGNQSATVELFDASGRTRIYDVPAGFTEDRVADGGSGWRRLDLTRLTPQPGFVASATAAEMSGFDALNVARIEVTLGSSGALDDLVYDAYP